jgi:excisionase family DNA binding protein
MPLREAAKWAGVSPKTLKRWISKGLPRYRVGGRGKVLVRPADIDQFLTKEAVSQFDLDRVVDDVVASVLKGL